MIFGLPAGACGGPPGDPAPAGAVMAKAASISQQIWDMKYRLKGSDGEPVDKSVSVTWRRVDGSLAAPETEPASWEARFV